jgi:uncharacterized protein YndB with AHSA1/START domain
MGREQRIDRAARVVPGPPDAVWRALTSGDQLERWLPPEGAEAHVQAYEAREGGPLRMTLRFPPGTEGKSAPALDEVVGRVVAVTKGRRLTWEVEFPSDKPENAGAMRMLWTLTPAGSGTRVTVEAIDPPPGIDREEHERALVQSLDKLAETVRGA